MALNKVNYIDGQTVIKARNLNEIQDEIIANGQAEQNLSNNLNTLNGTVNGHTSSINSLNSTVSEHTNSINSLNSTVSGHTSSIQSLQNNQITIASVASALYPVGSVYMSFKNNNPLASLIPNSKWLLHTDRFLIGAGASYQPGEKGGSKEHHHNTSPHRLSIEELPSHTHSVTYNNWKMRDTSTDGDGEYTNIAGSDYSKTSGATGGNQEHSHGVTTTSTVLPPYIAVYIWERTA